MERRSLGAHLYHQVQSIPLSFFTYFVVGGIAAVVDIGGFMLLTGPFHIVWFWAALCSFLAAVAVNYFLSIRFVFASGVRFSRNAEMALVLLVSAVGLVLNEIVLWALIERIGAARLLAKLIATGVVFLWNYGSRASFIFRAVPSGPND